MKTLKYGKLAMLRNPQALFKSKRSIRFQFDMFHGNGVLDKAIELLDDKDKHDFKNYVFNNTSYNLGNMFICKSKEIMNEYYHTIFKWLSECEKIFGFNLNGYNKIRVYAFLAERFLPYWFNKYVKTLEWPIIFNDLTKLPPSLIVVAGCDPLKDEGIAYGEKLKKAGNNVETKIFDGQIHGFLTMGARIKDTAKLISLVSNRINNAFK